MEQFITEIKQFADRHGISPAIVIRRSVDATRAQWESWEAGRSSPTLRVADKIRAWMAKQDAAKAETEAEADA